MKPSISSAIWDTLTPTQRASLFFIAEVSIPEIANALEDTNEDKKRIAEAKRRAGVAGASSWWLPRGTALAKKGLVKTVPYFGGTSSTQIVLTPLGRRVVEHGKRLLQGSRKTAARHARKGGTMKRFYGTIEYLPGKRDAIIALTDAKGDWFGAQRITLPRAKHGKQALYDLGYAAASVKATTHGGQLETFKEAKP